MEASMLQKTQPASLSSLRHAMVVDHDLRSVEETQRKLHSFSFRVTAIKTASTAISILKERGNGYFQLLIIDIDYSPDLAALMNLKQRGIEMRLPIVMTSKKENRVFERRVLKSGVCCFLVKPIDVHLLKAVCNQFASPKTTFQSVVNKTLSKIYGSQSNVDKKDNMIWDFDLNSRFLDAISKLSPENRSATRILQKMNVPGLTRKHVSSHLQRYLDGTKNSPNGAKIFPNYFIPSRDLQSSSNGSPNIENVGNSSQNDNQTVTISAQNTNVASNRRNVELLPNHSKFSSQFNPTNNYTITSDQVPMMNIDKGNQDFPLVNEINVDGILKDFVDNDKPASPYPQFPHSYDPTNNDSTMQTMMNVDKGIEKSSNIDSNQDFPLLNEINHVDAMTNFVVDDDRPTSPYPPFPESYDPIPDDAFSPTFSYALEQILNSSSSPQPDQIPENNKLPQPQPQPTPCVTNTEQDYSQFQMNLEFNSSNSGYVIDSDHQLMTTGNRFSVNTLGFPANFSNSNNSTRSNNKKDVHQWAVGSNPITNNNGDDHIYGLPADYWSDSGMPLPSSHEFDDVDFEGFF